MSKINFKIKSIFILPLFLLGWGYSIILPGVHPGYDLVSMRPESWKPYGIGGMDWLPDGRLAVAIWGLNMGGNGPQTTQGALVILTGVNGNGPVGVDTIAIGLSEPMGLRVIGNDIWVAERQEPDPSITKFTPAGGGNWTKSVGYSGWGVNEGYHWHIFTFGLQYMDQDLWFCPGSRLGSKGGPERGVLLQVDLANNTHSSFAGGIRTPNGLGIGPEYSFWTPDNEGDWLSHSKMIHLQKGRWYGHAPADYPEATWPNGNGRGSIDFPDRKEWNSAAYLTQDNDGSGNGSGNESGRSPTEPMYMIGGKYDGQFLAGDIHRGGLMRYFLERVNGDWQTAVFDFTQGLEAGINRLALGHDGESVILAGAGGSDSLKAIGGWTNFHSWNWKHRVWGFQKLVPNGNPVFEMLAMRSMNNSTFEIEFTEPAGASAGSAASYEVITHTWTPARGYGFGRNVDRHNLTVNSATLSGDKKKVTLNITGLQEGYIVHVKLVNVKSEAGRDLWGNDVWYTLNKFGPGEIPGINLPEQNSARGAISTGYPVRQSVSIKTPTGTVAANAAVFDGTDDQFHFQPILIPGDFSVSAWVNLQGTVDNKDNVFGLTNGPNLNFSTGKARLFNGTGDVVVATTTTPPNLWTHVGVTRNGNTVSIYINGVKEADGSWNGIFETEYLGLGAAGLLQGSIYDARVYRQGMNATEMLDLLNPTKSAEADYSWVHENTGFTPVRGIELGNLKGLSVLTGSTVQFKVYGLDFEAPQLDIYDVTGRKISSIISEFKDGIWKGYWIPNSNQQGVYFIKAQNNSQKLVKQFLVR